MVTSPPLARVRARGCASRAEGWSPPISGFLTASFGSHWVTGTPWAFLIRGGGALSAPSQALFHTHFSLCFPAPGFFLFFFLGLRGQRPRITCHELRMWNDAFQALLRRTPRNSLNATLKPTPSPPLLRFLVRFRGKCCAFFSGAVFREIPLIVLLLLRSSTLLRFLVQRVFCDELLRKRVEWG